MRNLIRAAVASIALTGLAGCATGFPAEVSRFEAMPAPTGETFYVVPAEGMRGGLEFSRYAEMVSKEMMEEGYAMAPSADEASMLVSLGYDVDEGRDRVVRDRFYLQDRFWQSPYYYSRYYPFYRSRYDPFFSRHRYYGSRLGFYYGWDDPFWFSPRGSRLSRYTEYRSELDVDITRTANGESIFEGNARARSTDDDLGTLVPNLIEAMFTDFPGRNGETVKITVKPERD